MKTLIPIITGELQAGRNIALATVLQSKGSAPRGPGACQVLTVSGQAFGTVGGGVLERRALDELQLLLNPNPASVADCVPTNSALASPPAQPELYTCPLGKTSSVQEYALTQNEVLSLGMVCGGNVVLVYQLLTPAMLPFFAGLNARLLEGRQNLWLVRCFDEGAVTRIAVTDGQTNPTSFGDNSFYPLCNRRAQWMNAPTAPESQTTAQHACFVEPVALISHTYIFGGGHVAQCVAPLLAQLDFSPVLYDDRPEFANRALFPTAYDVVCAPFTQAGERLTITRDDAIVIMTRGHVNDLLTLTQALRTQAYYIGLIGSRSKIAHTKEMLLSQGFTQDDFARVRTPIGLPIQAETPMEIAVSVAAEMILCRAERSAQV